ncbi:MAG: hypothetical protein WD739_13385 [Actinomycetota bacterium]
MRWITASIVLALMTLGVAPAHANSPTGLETVQDADDVGEKMVVDLKMVQSQVFGIDEPEGTSAFTIEAWDEFFFTELSRTGKNRLEVLLQLTNQHPGPDFVFKVYDDGDFGLRWQAVDLVTGLTVTNGDTIHSPGDPFSLIDSFSIVYDNSIIPKGDGSIFKWKVRSERYRRPAVNPDPINVDLAPDQGWAFQNGVVN